MDNLLTRLIDQLDSLIPFIGISREDVFTLIQEKENLWFQDSTDHLPDTYAVYRKQINHSSFLLGYSYFEAFLSDLAESIYIARPKMLPKQKKISFDEIVKAGTYEEALKIIVRKELHDLFYKTMRDIITYFADKLQLEWSSDAIEKFVEASCLRNCIIHNLGLADARLAMFPEYRLGEPFELTSSDVHSFGILGRREARNLWQQASTKHLGDV